MNDLYKQAQELAITKYKNKAKAKIKGLSKDDIVDYFVSNPFDNNEVYKLYEKLVTKKYENFVFTPQSYMELNVLEFDRSKNAKKRMAFIEDYIDKGVWNDGYYPETNQFALKVKFKKSQPFDSQLGILDFAPFIKPIDGVKIIGIFERSLSEYGIFTIEISNSTNKSSLIKTTWGQKKVIESFETLMDCLKYVHQHHYYEQ